MLQIPSQWSFIMEDPSMIIHLKRIQDFLDEEKAAKHLYYPDDSEIFSALEETPCDKVKVIIVGQDPYHGPLEAHGLAFSVPEGVRLPPSLRNIFKELDDDLHQGHPKSGNLLFWAKQGVLLLNTTLTVGFKAPLSHHGHGWEEITDAIIQAVVSRSKALVVMLWGNHAQRKYSKLGLTLDKNHVVLSAAHPSPFSAYRGFFTCRHFSKANEFLAAHGEKIIRWVEN
jgi:uracil-DNA glycosylase